MRIDQHLVALTGVGQQPEDARGTKLHGLGKSGRVGKYDDPCVFA